MARLSVFNSITLDGYFTGENGDLSWAHAASDPEWSEFIGGNASGGGALVFGRVTYEMMVSFWPTDAAKAQMPDVAAGMNRMKKYVFSRSMQHAAWENTTLIRDDAVAAMKKIKAESSTDLVILGSGTLVSQFTQAGLIDSYQFAVVPVVLGKGRTMFEGVNSSVKLVRTNSRAFNNGNVVLWYDRA